MYLARIVQSKWRVGREVIPELVFINTLGKQSCAGKGRMHTAPETWSGSSKATEGLGCGNDMHQSLPCQNRGLLRALHSYLLCGRGILRSQIAFSFLSLVSFAVIWPCIKLDNIIENLSS